MADAYKNFAYSTVATAPSPASSGTSLVVAAADGAKFPAVPFNATIWPIGAQPTTTNAERVRVTARSTDTLTIVRAIESTSARTVIVGDQIAATVGVSELTNLQGSTLGMMDFFITGCVWTGDALASTRAASMTAGTIWLGGRYLTVAAVTARTFTASKDTYIDFTDNNDGTATPVYTEVSNNAASPALTAGNIRNGIIVTGATTIAAAGSINQGQETKVLPIASSIPYAVTDSLGNLICNRSPVVQVIGYRQIIADFTTTALNTYTDVTGLSMPIIVPTTARKLRLTAYCGSMKTAGAAVTAVSLIVVEGSTQIAQSVFNEPVTGYNEIVIASAVTTPSSGSHTYKVQVYQNSSSTLTVQANATGGTSTPGPAYIMAELL